MEYNTQQFTTEQENTNNVPTIYEDENGNQYTKMKVFESILDMATNSLLCGSPFGVISPNAFNNFDISNIHGTPDAISVCKTCYNTFVSIGCTDAAAKGILANIAEESNFNPKIVTWDGSVKTGIFGVGGGLCGFYFNGALKDLAAYSGWSQAKLSEYNTMIKNSGLPKPGVPCHPANSNHIASKFGGFPFTFQQQLNYLCNVINTKYSAVKKMTNPADAAMYWIKYYERPAHIIDRWNKNGATVLGFLSK